MAKIHKWIAAVLCSIILAHISYANERAEGAERRPKDASKYLENVVVDTENIVVDKQLLDIYVRLMRYQTAGQDIAKYLGGKESKPEDYLTIAVDNVQIGKKGELSRYLKKVYSKRSNEILQILRNETCPEGESCSLSYAVEWISTPDASAHFTYPSEKGVYEYITYDLTVSYKGKSISHSGLILYYKSEKPEENFFVYDGIIPQINMAAMDKLPLARAAKRPSARAFRQSTPKKEVKKLKAEKIDGRLLESEDEEPPIGYLPSDAEIIDEGGIMTMMALVPCTPPKPTISGYNMIWWFNGATPSQYITSSALTSSGGSSTTWAVTQGSGKVSLSNTTGSQITVSSIGFSSNVGDIIITATANGQSSDPFSMTVKKPKTLSFISSDTQCNATYGYQTLIKYDIKDQFDSKLTSIVELNEQWSTNIIDDYTPNNWGRRPATGTISATINDMITGPDVNSNPAPNPMPTCGYNGFPVHHWGQEWYIGSTTVGTGEKVQTNTLQKYNTKGEHLP